MISRREFGRLLAETYGVTYQTADKICRQVFELLGILLYEKKEDVTILGFGYFKHKTSKGKTLQHPRTGETMTIPDKVHVKFFPSEGLKSKAE